MYTGCRGPAHLAGPSERERVRFSNSRRRVNILQFADDTCLIANSPASCQYLLDTSSNWLQWSGMSAKVPKCQCLSLQGSSGKLADPHPHSGWNAHPFLHWASQVLGYGSTSSQEQLCCKRGCPVKAPGDAPGHRQVVADEEAEAAALFWWGVSSSVLPAVDP